MVTIKGKNNKKFFLNYTFFLPIEKFEISAIAEIYISKE